MIQEQYVSFEIAKLLKEKGFDIPCYTVYNPINTANNVSHLCVNQSNTSFKEEPIYSAPTQSLAMRWLREVHKIFIQVTIVPHTTITMEQKYYLFSIHKNRRRLHRDDIPIDYYNTYEEACGSAIKYCLENLI